MDRITRPGRRRLPRNLTILLIGFAWVSLARAQDFPARFVKNVLPFAPGGGNDVFARYLAGRCPKC